MGPFLVFPRVEVFRSHRNNTPVNVGLAALSALPPDPVVTEALGQTVQASGAFQNLGRPSQQPCCNSVGLDLGGRVSES